MARKPRVQYPGAIYHVMNRGDRREPIFKDDADHQWFLETLGEAGAKTGWQVHAYCLMLNHFHLVVETPQGNLVAGMKWFLGTYTSRFNRRHQLFGHLFSGRYKSLIVDGEAGERRAEGGRAGAGGTASAWVDGGGIGEAPQDGCWEGEGGGAVAGRDGDDAGLDCGTVANGMSAYVGQRPERAANSPNSRDTFSSHFLGKPHQLQRRYSMAPRVLVVGSAKCKLYLWDCQLDRILI